MPNSVARSVISSSIDSMSLHSVTEVSDLLFMISALAVAPLHVLLDDNLLPNRSRSGERGADGRWLVWVGESRRCAMATGEDEGDLVLKAVSVHTVSSVKCLKKRSDVGITEPKLDVEDMLVNALGGDRTAETIDDERERFDGTAAAPSTA